MRFAENFLEVLRCAAGLVDVWLDAGSSGNESARRNLSNTANGIEPAETARITVGAEADDVLPLLISNSETRGFSTSAGCAGRSLNSHSAIASGKVQPAMGVPPLGCRGGADRCCRWPNEREEGMAQKTCHCRSTSSTGL